MGMTREEEKRRMPKAMYTVIMMYTVIILYEAVKSVLPGPPFLLLDLIF